MAELRAGPASLAGLEWLVRVGVAPMEAWACAMGWGDRVARSHASRLERAGWLDRRMARRAWRGPREVLTDPNLDRTVVWSTRSSLRRSGHRPDLMLHALPGLLAVEVELQRKSASRMVGIASMY